MIDDNTTARKPHHRNQLIGTPSGTAFSVVEKFVKTKTKRENRRYYIVEKSILFDC